MSSLDINSQTYLGLGTRRITQSSFASVMLALVVTFQVFTSSTSLFQKKKKSFSNNGDADAAVSYLDKYRIG